MSEAVLLWGIGVVAVLAVFIPYLVAFVRRNRADRERKKEAAELGIDKPVAQYPYIDPNRCVGCGACVKACPEGDVLGLVGGTSVVINGLRCVGHARCEEACPVGAIEVGVGDLKSRKDVPLLDDDMQTNLPRVYVAGELGGIALVKNAALQGRQAVEVVADRVSSGIGGGPGALDLLIVGAGPAGLSASLMAKTLGLSYKTLEKEDSLGGSILHYPRRKMVLTQPVDLSPWGSLNREEYSKEDLLDVFWRMVGDNSLEVNFGEPLEELERENGHYLVRSKADEYRAKHVVLAIGRRGSPRKLGVPGEDLPKVMYRLIDAESYQGKKILVVGGGDSAIEAAIGLARQEGNEVTLSYRKERLFRIKKKNEDKIQELFESGEVEPIFSSNLAEVREDTVRLTKGEDDTVTLENDYVFIFAGGVPPFRFLQQMGVEFGGKPESCPSEVAAASPN